MPNPRFSNFWKSYYLKITWQEFVVYFLTKNTLANISNQSIKMQIFIMIYTLSLQQTRTIILKTHSYMQQLENELAHHSFILKVFKCASHWPLKFHLNHRKKKWNRKTFHFFLLALLIPIHCLTHRKNSKFFFEWLQ